MQVLQKKALEMGIDLDETQLKAFQVYMDTLLAWNQRMNLTGITKPSQIIVKHFEDSLTVLRFLPHNTPSGASRHLPQRERLLRVIDAGTGAGFPGVPLAIAAPFLSVTLMDSTKKKLGFLDELIKLLELKNARTVHCRLEDACKSEEHKGKYEAVVSRAVAPMSRLAGYCLPFVVPGGYMYAMKGPSGREEAIDAESVIDKFGGRIERFEEMRLYDSVENEYMGRTIVIIKKRGYLEG